MIPSKAMTVSGLVKWECFQAMLNTCLINLKPYDCLQCDYDPKSTSIVSVKVVVRLFMWWNNHFWKPDCFSEGKCKSLSGITWAPRPGLPRGSFHKTGTTQHRTLHVNKHTFPYKELVQGCVFHLLPRSRRKSSKGWGRSADRFSFLGFSKVPSGWRAAGSLGIGKSPLGLQRSKPISQLPSARMAVGAHLHHTELLGCTGVDNPIRTLVSWHGLQPEAGHCGCNMAMARPSSDTSRDCLVQSLLFPPPRSDKTVCHLLITWILLPDYI